jgi:C1A family cysteine protease
MMHFAKAAAILGFENMFMQDEVSELHMKFKTHMDYEGLTYGTREEYEFRFEIFQKKDAEIEYWNNQQDSYKLGHNMFSTMTDAESKQWLGATPEFSIEEPAKFDEGLNAATVDWRSNGAVNAVKNQGSCGSCWAFGATAGTEHAHWRQSQTLLNLSEQQLVDCDTRSHGCNGGFHTNAWEYLKSHP